MNSPRSNKLNVSDGRFALVRHVGSLEKARKPHLAYIAYHTAEFSLSRSAH